MAILNNNPLVGASGNQGGYNINNSLRFRGSATAYLSRTPASAGNRKTWTWSAWIKLGTISVNMGTLFIAQGQTAIYLNDGTTSSFRVNGAAGSDLITSLMPRDPSAWYHLVVACDTTQATDTNRLKIYVNGVQQTAFQAGSAYPTLNGDTYVNSTAAHYIGRRVWNSDQQYDGYIAEQYLIDGSQKAASDFGETDTTTGVWKPKAYSGTYGTNGFYLKFSDIATTSGSNAGLGKDFSGNSNYWTTNNISVTSGTTYDAMTDSPTNTSATVANYCVWNPLKKPLTGSYSNGNLTIVGGTDTESFGTMAYPSTGSFYFEYLVATTGGGGFGPQVGICTLDGNYTVKYFRNGYKGVNGTNTAYGGAWALNDIIGIAYNASTNTVTFYKNNVSQGDITASSGQEYFPYFFDNSSSTHNFTFGQRPFTYTPPTGYLALNTFNLPNPTILQGNKYMDATLWTGTGSGITITNAGGFKPDLVWYKQRNGTRNHLLFNSVSGTTKYLQSNTTNAEQTDAQSLTSFNSNGFTLGTNGNGATNGETYVGWQWQAGQGTNTTNTAGSITSTVSVNTTAGFSIVTYTGIGSSPKTVGHGLGVAPKMILLKNRSSAVNWYVWHTSLGATQVIEGLNTTAAAGAQITFNNTLPTSSVISLGNNDSNNNGTNYVLYVWAEIAGFSRFGSYTGNGSTDGTFVYTGFRPKYILIKRTNLTEDWYIYDTSRITYNLGNIFIYADLVDAEGTGATGIDILSNGFKQRQTGGGNNASGSTYIYAAFAENPFKNSLAR